MKKLPDKNCNLNELKDFCNVNFIITDIDGTLVKGGDGVIKQINSKIRFNWGKAFMTIATGRTFFGARKVIEELDIPRGIPLVLYNGSVIIAYQTNELLLHKTIPKYFLKKLENALNLEKEHFLVYTMKLSDKAFGITEDMVVEKVYGIGKVENGVDVNGLDIEKCKDSNDLLISPCSVLIDKSALSRESQKKVYDVLDHVEEVAYTDSGNGFVEISRNGVNKGIVFQIIQEKYPFLIKKSLAIGDNDNDCELLKAADIGVAVANGSDDAKQAADYICEHEGAAGVLDVIHTLKNASKYWGE